MSRYLVTGGAGFIGRHLVGALLAEGHEVLVLDDGSTGNLSTLPSDVQRIEASILDSAARGKALRGIDGCFHLAAVVSVERSWHEWATASRVNLMGTIELVADLAESGIPLVYTSSAAVYGDNPALPLSEALPVTPLTPYGIDKAAGEMHCRAGALKFGLVSTCLRLFNVYGPGQDGNSPYAAVISKFRDDARLSGELTIFGDGDNTRDFVHVADVVRFLIAAMHSGTAGSQIYNVCSGMGTSVRTVAETMLSLLGLELDIRFAPQRPGDILHSQGDPALALSELEMRATIDLHEGLADLLKQE